VDTALVLRRGFDFGEFGSPAAGFLDDAQMVWGDRHAAQIAESSVDRAQT
jgi:hypothetical protein